MRVRQKLVLVTSVAVMTGSVLYSFVNYKSFEKRRETHAWAHKCGHPVFEKTDFVFPGFLGQWVGFSKRRLMVELVITDLSFSDLTRVSEIKELRSLNVWSTELTDIRPIAKLKNLQFLNLNNTQVADITPLCNLPSLKCVSLVGSPVLDFSPLASIADLEKVYISDKQLATAESSLTLPGVQTIVVSSDKGQPRPSSGESAITTEDEAKPPQD